MTEQNAKPLALIIEDAHELVTAFTTALQLAGYETDAAYDGATALTKLETTVPYLILLDLHLPHVSGEDIFRRIRNDTRFDKTRIIFVTADHNSAQYLVSGRSEFILLKPVSFKQLKDMASRLNPGAPI